MIGNGTPITPWRLVNLEFLRPFRPDLPPNAGLVIPSDGWDDTSPSAATCSPRSERTG